MHAYICKKTKALDARNPLRIKDQNVAFFIDPLERNSSFLSSDDGNKWHLSFFATSPFPQEVVVYIDCNEGEKKRFLGKSCWLNNAGSSEKNAELREEASLFLRESKTLALEQGRELTFGRFLIADRDGIAYFSKDPDQFRRIVLCQALAIAYTQVLYDCIAKLTEHVKGGSVDDTLALYESILRFNAADYFSLPVLLDRHELFAAWQVLSEHYKLSLLSQELTQQLSDVATLMHAKREQERYRQEKEKEKRENLLRDSAAEETLRQKERGDKKDKRRNFWLALIGVCLTATSLLQLTPKQVKESASAWGAWWNEPSTAQANTAVDSSIPSKTQSITQSARKK